MIGACLSRIELSVESKASMRSGRDLGESKMRSEDARSVLKAAMSIELIRRNKCLDGGGRGVGVMLSCVKIGK